MKRYFFVIAVLAFIGCDQSQVTDDGSATRTEEVELLALDLDAPLDVADGKELSYEIKPPSPESTIAVSFHGAGLQCKITDVNGAVVATGRTHPDFMITLGQELEKRPKKLTFPAGRTDGYTIAFVPDIATERVRTDEDPGFSSSGNIPLGTPESYDHAVLHELKVMATSLQGK